MDGRDGLSIHLLGRFSVRRGGEEIARTAFGGRLVRVLVRVLAADLGAYRSKASLADAIWGEALPADPDGNLEVLVSRARRALAVPSAIRTAEGGYSLDPQQCRVDAADFEHGVQAAATEARAGHQAAALRLYLAALDDWGGEPLPEDAYAAWAEPARQALLLTYSQALEGAAAAALAVRDPGQAVGLASRAVARDPLREPAHLLLVEALAAAGDSAAALAAYEALRATLAEELGLDPSPAAAALQTRVLRGELAPTRAPTRTPRASTSDVVATQPLAFVGREPEISLLAAALEAHRPLLVVGPSGSGKSRLLAELLSRTPRRVLSVRAFPADAFEPWSVVGSLLRDSLTVDDATVAGLPEDLVAALGDLLPDLTRRGGRRPGGRTQRAFTGEAVTRLLGGELAGGAVLAVDDAQWADPTSLLLLADLPRRIPGLSLVLTLRPEGLSRPEVRAVVDDLRDAARLTEVMLGDLTVEAVADLIADPDLAATVSASADLLPQSLTELLMGLSRAGLVQQGGDRRWRPVPAVAAEDLRRALAAGRRSAWEARVARLRTGQRDVALLVAELRRGGSASLIASALGSDESAVLTDLDSLAQQGLVLSSDDGWLPMHDAVAEVLLASATPAQRQQAHARLATALRRAGAEASEVAVHLAGAGRPGEAAEAYVLAAERALGRHANEEAEELSTSGLDLGPADPWARRATEVRAEARTRRGDLAGARADLRTLLATAPTAQARSMLLSRTAMLVSGSEDLARASDLAERALTEAGDDPRALAEALTVGSVLAMNAGDDALAGERAERAVSLWRELADSQGIARVLDIRAMAGFLAGRVAESIEAFDRVARLFEDSGELMQVVTPRSTRGHALVYAGRCQEGAADAAAALDLARRLGHREGQAYALWHLSEATAGLGDADTATAHALEAVDIARAIPHRGWTASALRALGIARALAADSAGAEAALRESIELSAGLDLFRSAAAARLVVLLVDRGDLAGARAPCELALATGPPLAGFEARWAQAELAAAAGDPDTGALASRALALAEQAGHLATCARLRALVG